MLGEDVSIGIAHGKMSESQLSRVMQDMADGDIQVLVCTTIIETGIDIPNVNTLIIEDADRMGLAQLHQIRGRIGRSPRRAYAYLTFRPGKILTEVAGKRRTAIREYVEFGSGFKIAMRDLEIRGAGNLLGPEQSGYMMSVGYDMYLKLLNDAVLEQQGKAAQIRPECSADLTVSAYIPDSYIPQAKQRMDLYRRIASIRTAADSGEILDELLDRFGDPPRAVTALLDVALLRSDAAQVGICDISQKGQQLIFRFTERVDPPSLLAVCSLSQQLDVLALGSDTARSLGLPVGSVRFLLLVLAAALSGAAVSFSGLLGFVGLIVPHAMRRLVGADSFPLLAASALGGACFVTICDLLARVLFAPFELPVGVVLAFAGVPFFLWLLFRQRGGRT